MNEKEFNQALCQIIDAIKTLECDYLPELAAFILRENPLIVKADLNNLVWTLSRGNAHHNDFAMIWEGIYRVLPDVNKAIAPTPPSPDALVEAVKKIAEHPHCTYKDGGSQYETGVVDGHRCAAEIAKAALAAHEKAVK